MVKLDSKTKGFINSALRRIFGWSEQYKACKKRAFRGKVNGDEEVYECEGCNSFLRKNIDDKFHVDHINPVVPINGWISDIHYASDVISRMFPYLDELQYLCGICHYMKTQIENDERREFKKGIKNEQ